MITKKHTRYWDLATLEEKRDKAKSKRQRQHIEAIIAQVYEQIKDPTIERLRMMIADEIRLAAEAKTDELMDFHLGKVEELRKRARDYFRSSLLPKRIASKIEKAAGKSEAELFFKQQRRG